MELEVKRNQEDRESVETGGTGQEFQWGDKKGSAPFWPLQRRISPNVLQLTVKTLMVGQARENTDREKKREKKL